jgi:hypothetical protein
MKSLLFAAALSLPGCSLASPASQSQCVDRLAPAETGGGAKPLVVLVESNPWAMVIGSDSPRFALYSDGVVIYQTAAGYHSVKLSETESKELQAALDVGALACALGDYKTTDWTDQNTESLFIGRGGALAAISVYGDPASSKVPSAMRSAYARLSRFDRSDARPWLPENIEVMVWPYEYAPDASIVWPREWPGLDSPNTVRRGDSYSIFLPSVDYARLIAFLKGRRGKGAVEIGGRKWAAAIRMPFPQEMEWFERSRRAGPHGR